MTRRALVIAIAMLTFGCQQGAPEAMETPPPRPTTTTTTATTRVADASVPMGGDAGMEPPPSPEPDAGLETAPDGYPEGPYGFERMLTIPNLSFQTVEGEMVTMQALREDYDVILWGQAAPWCPTCIQKRTQFQALQETFENERVLIVMSLVHAAGGQIRQSDLVDWIGSGNDQVTYLVLKQEEVVYGNNFNDTWVIFAETMQVFRRGWAENSIWDALAIVIDE